MLTSATILSARAGAPSEAPTPYEADRATQGMPFEVWKTRMGRHRTEGTVEAFMNVYRRGGIGGFWAGLGAIGCPLSRTSTSTRTCHHPQLPLQPAPAPAPALLPHPDTARQLKERGPRCGVTGVAGPKMVESATKGAILMYSKEMLNDSFLSSGFSPTTSGKSGVSRLQTP